MADLPEIMGILNVTPDSFYDGGKYNNVKLALEHAENMIKEGATIIDVGGESTRPFAKQITLEEEMARVVPIITALKKEFNVKISVDTSQPLLMQKALELGVEIINDIRALTVPGALACLAQSKTANVCLMHMQNQPDTMQNFPKYENVTTTVKNFLKGRIAACAEYGIPKDRIIIDPGFGFGKLPDHNLILLNQLEDLHSLGCRILVGWSRKSTIGKVLNKPVSELLYGSLAAAALSLFKGASILRVHDVGPTCEIMKFIQATLNQEKVI